MTDSLSKNGRVTLAKALMDHEVWHLDAFSRGQAWVDLLLAANDANRTFMANGRPVEVFRGQTGYSLKSLARRWRWSDEKVSGFIQFLERAGMISRRSTGVTTIITVNNYETYNSEDTEPDAGADTEPGSKTVGEPDAVTDTKTDTEPATVTEQKVEVGSKEVGKEEETGARGGFVAVPSDEEFMAFGAEWTGCPATGAPRMPVEFVARILADLHGRREFPPRWQKVLVNRWRAEFREWVAKKPGEKTGRVQAPESVTSRRISMERRAKALEQVLEEHITVCAAPPHSPAEMEDFRKKTADLRDVKEELSRL